MSKISLCRINTPARNNRHINLNVVHVDVVVRVVVRVVVVDVVADVVVGDDVVVVVGPTSVTNAAEVEKSEKFLGCCWMDIIAIRGGSPPGNRLGETLDRKPCRG